MRIQVACHSKTLGQRGMHFQQMQPNSCLKLTGWQVPSGDR